ncbi:MAG: acyl carrier protein [Paludibacteraceae bacterium]|nr:acyl carrier protein [Paludibacteraceae bacterium]
MSEIEQKVKAIIVDKLGVDPQEVTMEANFTTDLNADSLDLVDLIMDLEKAFKVTIPEEETQNIATVGDAVRFVEKTLGK